MATWLIIVIVVWLVGIPVCYSTIVKKWNHPMWEKIMISLSWPVMIPLYLIYLVRKALM